MYSLTTTKFSSIKIWFLIGNLFLTLFWWNISIQFFIFLQFLTRTEAGYSRETSKAMLFFHDNFFSTILIVTAFVTVQWLVDKLIIEKLRSRQNLIVTTLFQFSSFLSIYLITVLLVGLYYYSIFLETTITDTFYNINSFIFGQTVLYFFLVGLMIKFSLGFYFEVQKRLGYKMFSKFLVGYYKKPKEENRIFLFIDLVSSTECSEQLGHVKYSEFLQDCFYILDNTVIKTRGFVYQHVGDEAVISWKANKPHNFFRAIDFLYIFNDNIKSKKNHFIGKYGILPKFTASLNSGKIMVAEVGYVKSEIAYHGNVLNTAARLQKQCKEYGAGLLATENFTKQLKNLNRSYSCDFLDEVQFSGKKEKERIFRIDKLA